MAEKPKAKSQPTRITKKQSTLPFLPKNVPSVTGNVIEHAKGLVAIATSVHDSRNNSIPRPELGTELAPIDLCESPLRRVTSPTVHPFFSRPKVDITAKLSSVNTKNTAPVAAPWPTRTSQHCNNPQTVFSTAPSPFQKRTLLPRSSLEKQLSAFIHHEDDLFLDCFQTIRVSHLSSPPPEIPKEHLAHPALSSLLHSSPRTTGEIWSTKYRPRAANQLLGNNQHTEYLKSWLQKLEIQMGASTPTATMPARKLTIQREVAKRGRKHRRIGYSPLSWVVDDDDAIESFSEGSDSPPWESSPLRSSPPPLRLPSSQMTPDSPLANKAPAIESSNKPSIDFSDRLTNAILLSGPAGSGKTAAVYACAEELGWGVFEVYPGVGKRSSAGLQSFIGDVVDNHLVRGKKRKAPCEDDDDQLGFMEKSRVRQSMVLLEEVDVLFKEDSGFWTMVVNLIRQSRRPFIMTCNDLTLIPIEQLPLQTTLEFTACEPDLAASYLQSIAALEGHSVDRESTKALYSWIWLPISADAPDAPGHPLPYQVPPTWDLRRSINQLQILCFGLGTVEVDQDMTEKLADWAVDLKMLGPAIEDTTDEPFGMLTLHRLSKMAECSSFSDAFLGRRAWDIIDAESIDRYNSTLDDEVGHTLLPKRSTGLTNVQRDEEMAKEVMQRARVRFEQMSGGVRSRDGLEVKSQIDLRGLRALRAEYQERIVPTLDSLITLQSPLLPRPALILDYVPYIQGLN